MHEMVEFMPEGVVIFHLHWNTASEMENLLHQLPSIVEDFFGNAKKWSNVILELSGIERLGVDTELRLVAAPQLTRIIQQVLTIASEHPLKLVFAVPTATIGEILSDALQRTDFIWVAASTEGWYERACESLGVELLEVSRANLGEGIEGELIVHPDGVAEFVPDNSYPVALWLWLPQVAGRIVPMIPGDDKRLIFHLPDLTENLEVIALTGVNLETGKVPQLIDDTLTGTLLELHRAAVLVVFAVPNTQRLADLVESKCGLPSPPTPGIQRLQGRDCLVTPLGTSRKLTIPIIGKVCEDGSEDPTWFARARELFNPKPHA